MSANKNLTIPLHNYLSSPHSVKECAHHFGVSTTYAFTTIQKFLANGEVTLDSKSGHTKFYRSLPLKESVTIHPLNTPRLVSFANSTRPLSNDCIGTARKSSGWEGYSSPINKA